jgi:4'-phosphopantetheinyl transferase
MATIWLARTDRPLPPEARHWLDDEEQARLARLLCPTERRRRLTAWCLRRYALSQACPDIAPQDWRFRALPGGKPILAAAFDHLGLAHNLSHAGAYPAVMVARHACGLDVEAPPGGLEGMAEALTAMEMADVRSHPHPADRFLAYWTAKEAILKWRGDGLAIAPTSLAVAIAEDGSAATVANSPVPLPSALRIMLRALPEGHRLAAAYEAADGPPPIVLEWRTSG